MRNPQVNITSLYEVVYDHNMRITYAMLQSLLHFYDPFVTLPDFAAYDMFVSIEFFGESLVCTIVGKSNHNLSTILASLNRLQLPQQQASARAKLDVHVV